MIIQSEAMSTMVLSKNHLMSDTQVYNHLILIMVFNSVVCALYSMKAYLIRVSYEKTGVCIYTTFLNISCTFKSPSSFSVNLSIIHTAITF